MNSRNDHYRRFGTVTLPIIPTTLALCLYKLPHAWMMPTGLRIMTSLIISFGVWTIVQCIYADLHQRKYDRG